MKRKNSRMKQRLAIHWKKPARFKVPIPRDEPERLVALHHYKILDTPPEDDFDNIAALAAHICGTPIALVSLVDSDRQWFKARVGLSVAETSRDIAFCAYAIMQRGLFVVPDATKDKRFAENPLVEAEPKIRFYAGAPLVTPDDHAIGTLCVLDRVPRQLKAAQTEALRALSRQVMNQLEMRKKIYDLRHELLARGQHEKVLQRHVRLAHAACHGQRQLLHRAAHRLQAGANLIATLLQRASTGGSSDESRETVRVTKAAARSLLTLAREMKQHAGKPQAPR